MGTLSHTEKMRGNIVPTLSHPITTLVMRQAAYNMQGQLVRI